MQRHKMEMKMGNASATSLLSCHVSDLETVIESLDVSSNFPVRQNPKPKAAKRVIFVWKMLKRLHPPKRAGENDVGQGKASRGGDMFYFCNFWNPDESG